MKSIALFILTAVAAFALTGCEPAANVPANTATTAPAKAPATKDALLALDKAAQEAFLKGDSSHFEGMLSDKFTTYGMGQRMTKAELVKMVAGTKCDVKTWSLDEPELTLVDIDTAILTYKGTFDGTCTGADGKSMKMPSPVRAASVWVRNGDKWQGAFHDETPIIAPPPTATEVKKVEQMKRETMMDDAPPPPPKEKAEPKSDAGKSDDAAPKSKAEAEKKKAAAAETAGSETSTIPAATERTAIADKLIKMHTDGWEAFKNKDAAAFGVLLADNFAFVDPMGKFHGLKAEAIKLWTGGMKCEGVTSVKVEDGQSFALSPTAELVTLKGTANGTCDGQKNGPIYQSAVYVNSGQSWKLVYMFETIAAKK